MSRVGPAASAPLSTIGQAVVTLTAAQPADGRPGTLLGSVRADPANLKLMILSTPKTGNTWLRWLLHYAYGTPIVESPNEWDDRFAASLSSSFVSHQHLPPSESLVRWLVQNRVAVLTTIRHPGDTFISLFHFVKWSDDGDDPALSSLKGDGDSPGRNAQRYLQYSFPQAYALSLSWARLGAVTVRYEDLLANPLDELRRIAAAIAPVHDDKIRAAAFLCKPERQTRPGLVDRRHPRVTIARRWTVELGGEHLELMRRLQPYRSACERYGYDWNRDTATTATFDYDTIDPFRGLTCFDNGEPIGSALAKIYYHDVGNAFRRWPEPATTAGESFWKWLVEPLAAARGIEWFPHATLTNLMWSIYRMRTDLQVAYPDPLHGDRIRFANWFISRACVEFALPWGLVSPVADAYCDFLQLDTPAEAPTAGLITDVVICDASGIKSRAFACGDQLSVSIEFELFERVERPILECSLRNHAGVTSFGTNTTLLGSPLPALDAGVHRCRIDTRLHVPPQQAYLSNRSGMQPLRWQAAANPSHGQSRTTRYFRNRHRELSMVRDDHHARFCARRSPPINLLPAEATAPAPSGGCRQTPDCLQASA